MELIDEIRRKERQKRISLSRGPKKKHGSWELNINRLDMKTDLGMSVTLL